MCFGSFSFSSNPHSLATASVPNLSRTPGASGFPLRAKAVKYPLSKLSSPPVCLLSVMENNFSTDLSCNLQTPSFFKHVNRGSEFLPDSFFRQRQLTTGPFRHILTRVVLAGLINGYARTAREVLTFRYPTFRNRSTTPPPTTTFGQLLSSCIAVTIRPSCRVWRVQ